mmetsp:Transcript_5259/g.14929  ORF Transcript_5259/g.14929 Transcript_5259/m.14929 type:complete len:214 (+) Transcript_5259:466-1107(+)
MGEGSSASLLWRKRSLGRVLIPVSKADPSGASCHGKARHFRALRHPQGSEGFPSDIRGSQRASSQHRGYHEPVCVRAGGYEFSPHRGELHEVWCAHRFHPHLRCLVELRAPPMCRLRNSYAPSHLGHVRHRSVRRAGRHVGVLGPEHARVQLYAVPGHTHCCDSANGGLPWRRCLVAPLRHDALSETGQLRTCQHPVAPAQEPGDVERHQTRD